MTRGRGGSGAEVSVNLSLKGCLVYFFIFILFQIEIPVNELCRP